MIIDFQYKLAITSEGQCVSEGQGGMCRMKEERTQKYMHRFQARKGLKTDLKSPPPPDELHDSNPTPNPNESISLPPLSVWTASVRLSALIKRRLGPRSFLPKAFNDLLDSSYVKSFLPEFIRSEGAEFFAVAAEAVLVELVRERIR